MQKNDGINAALFKSLSATDAGFAIGQAPADLLKSQIKRLGDGKMEAIARSPRRKLSNCAIGSLPKSFDCYPEPGRRVPIQGTCMPGKYWRDAPHRLGPGRHTVVQQPGSW
jgi:hypothetical protein